MTSSQKPMRRQNLSMRGVAVDIDALRAASASTVALGNANMNARGDILGPDGKVTIRREQIVQDYYRNNPQGVKRTSLKDVDPSDFETPQQAIERIQREINSVPEAPQVTAASPVVDTPTVVLGKNRGRRISDQGE